MTPGSDMVFAQQTVNSGRPVLLRILRVAGFLRFRRISRTLTASITGRQAGLAPHY